MKSMRTIDWIFLCLLFFILGDVAPAHHPDPGIFGITTHGWNTGIGVIFFLIATFYEPKDKV